MKLSLPDLGGGHDFRYDLAVDARYKSDSAVVVSNHDDLASSEPRASPEASSNGQVIGGADPNDDNVIELVEKHTDEERESSSIVSILILGGWFMTERSHSSTCI